MFWESLTHQWAADYFLVRMVVPGTKPVENPCYSAKPYRTDVFSLLSAALKFHAFISKAGCDVQFALIAPILFCADFSAEGRDPALQKPPDLTRH